MLVFLLTSMSARGFNVDGWVHDLSHHGQKNIAGLGSEQADWPDASGKSSPGSLDEVEQSVILMKETPVDQWRIRTSLQKL